MAGTDAVYTIEQGMTLGGTLSSEWVRVPKSLIKKKGVGVAFEPGNLLEIASGTRLVNRTNTFNTRCR